MTKPFCTPWVIFGYFVLTSLTLPNTLIAENYIPATRSSQDVRWTWTDSWDENFYIWCSGYDVEDRAVARGWAYNSFANEPAYYGCGNNLGIADEILLGSIANRQWFQGRLFSYYTGNTTLFPNGPYDVDFLTLDEDNDFAVWYEISSPGEEEPWQEGVFVHPIEELPRDGAYIDVRGTVGFGGQGHVDDLNFATINYQDLTIRINSTFEGFGSTPQYGRETWFIFSEPLEIHPDSGFFTGDLQGRHRDAAGRTWNYDGGTVAGYVGGERGTRVVALYKWGGNRSSNFLLGYVP